MAITPTKKSNFGEYSETETQEFFKYILNDNNNFSAIKNVKELVSKNYSVCLVGNTFIPDLVKKAIYAQNDFECDTPRKFSGTGFTYDANSQINSYSV